MVLIPLDSLPHWENAKNHRQTAHPRPLLYIYIYIYTTCLDDFPTKTSVNEECSIIFHILSTFIDDIPIKTFI